MAMVGYTGRTSHRFGAARTCTRAKWARLLTSFRTDAMT